MKTKRILSLFLALVLVVGCMSITAFADSGTELAANHTTWTEGENLIVSNDLTMSGPVTVTGNVTLNIAEGATLTINGKGGDWYGESGSNGLYINDNCKLTVNGKGTLEAKGGNGYGGSGFDGINGGNGGIGIIIGANASMDVSNGKIIAKGGAGGEGDFTSNGSSGDGISIAANGSLNVSGGEITAKGSDGFVEDANTEGFGIDGGIVTIKGGSVIADGGHQTLYIPCINNSKITMTAGKLKLGSENVSFASGTSFSGGIMTFEVPADYVANGYECVANTDSATSGSYPYMVQKLLAITNGAPQTNEETNHGYITVSAESAKKNTEITVTAYPADGYKLDKIEYAYNDGSDQKVDITSAKKFNMPAYEVTVSAVFSEIKTSGTDIDLDLEDGTAAAESTTIDQYYTKTTDTKTDYNHRIGVQWSNDTMNIKVANAKIWNPGNLAWETDPAKNGVATVDGETNKTTFTLTNYSAKAFTCNVTFAVADGLASKFASYAVDGTDVTLEAVANDITQPGTSIANGVTPTATITATITPTLTGDNSFAGAAASASAKYGQFTVTCTTN